MEKKKGVRITIRDIDANRKVGADEMKKVKGGALVRGRFARIGSLSRQTTLSTSFGIKLD